jgi:hypothetical protein
LNDCSSGLRRLPDSAMVGKLEPLRPGGAAADVEKVEVADTS